MRSSQRPYRSLVLLAFAVPALTSCSPAEESRVRLDVHVGGRTVVSEDDTQRHTFTWPGVYFEARFAGPSVGLEVDDSENTLRLLVDGRPRLTLPRAGRASLVLRNLGPGEHVVRLEKLSETQGPTGAFLGFFVTDAAAARPAPRYDRLIEFIGDSNTLAYGVASTGRECTSEQVRDTTNTSLAFAPTVAARLNADYRIIASSGFGMVRNYANGNPGKTMPVLYERALHDDPHSTPRAEASPDVIVIGLGTNDFSTPVGPDEAWPDTDALHSNYRDTYVDFVRRLVERHAPSLVVLVSDPLFSADIDAVRAKLNEHRIGPVTVFELPELGRTACHYHYSAADHARVAARLSELLANTGLFGT